ncbi:MAG: symporter small accessory protein [Phycisphaeraceae bacterium]
MFGLADPIVLLAFLLCPLSALACVIYGIAQWRTGRDDSSDPS